MRDQTLIRGCDQHCYTWAANEQVNVVVECTPGPGRTLASWGSFVLTIRQDPCWVRVGADLFQPVDPSGEGWAIAVQSTGIPDLVGGINVAFNFAVPSLPGEKRYVLDVRGIGGVAGTVVFIGPHWLSVSPSIM